MPRNGSGTFSAAGSTWVPGVNGVTATTADFNALRADIESGLTQSVSKDGQTPLTGNLPMGSNKLTGLAPGTAQTDAAAVSQLGTFSGYTTTATNLTLTADNAGEYIKITSGGVTITLPAGSALRAGDTFTFGTSDRFTIARAGADTISGPTGTGLTSIVMAGPCSVVWRGDVFEIILGGNSFVIGAAQSYIHMAGGLLMQMGSHLETVNASGDGTITFPLAFPTVCFCVVLCNGNNTLTTIRPNINSSTTTVCSFKYPAAGAISTRTSWVAYGY